MSTWVLILTSTWRPDTVACICKLLWWFGCKRQEIPHKFIGQLVWSTQWYERHDTLSKTSWKMKTDIRDCPLIAKHKPCAPWYKSTQMHIQYFYFSLSIHDHACAYTDTHTRSLSILFVIFLVEGFICKTSSNIMALNSTASMLGIIGSPFFRIGELWCT